MDEITRQIRMEEKFTIQNGKWVYALLKCKNMYCSMCQPLIKEKQ